MASWGKCDYSQLQALQAQLESLGESGKDQCLHECAQEIGQRLLRGAVKRTPVGVPPEDLDETAAAYWAGYTGGQLRNAWTVEIQQQGGYVVILRNPTEYASYVEYGHRQQVGRFVPALGKRLVRPWVKGQFMMTLTAQEVQKQLPSLVQRKVTKYLKEALDGQ